MQRLLLNGYAFHRHWYGLGSAYRAALRALVERERWEPERMREYQDAGLRAVVRTAPSRSLYYREIMDGSGLKPEDIRGVGDLSMWGGMGPSDWIGMFLGRVIVPPTQRRPPFWRANVVQREVWFSSFHMSEDSLGSYVAEIRRRRLRFLEGYPSTLFILATYLRRAGETLPMTAVFSSSETLHPVQRETIESAFTCRLFDFYGLAERTIFAGECEVHRGRHIAEDFGFTEVVDSDGLPVPPGSWGYLVGTSLHNRAMPMLRYRTNDVSRILERRCSCGRTSRVLDPVTTKAEDVIVTPDGRLISPSILTHPFKPFDTIVKSQLIQEAPDRVLVKIVVGERFTDEQEHELIASLQIRLGDSVNIDVAHVDEIPPERSGKFRWVISRVDAGYSPAWDRYASEPPSPTQA
jgi:phenylacetate-CoA ligase